MNIMLGVKDVKGVIADLLEKLGGDDSFAWFTELKKFLRKEPCWLKIAQNMFNAHEYFAPRAGLWVKNGFVNLIFEKPLEIMPARGLSGVVYHDLPLDMTDQEIIDKILGGIKGARKHAFTLDQVAEMIDLQSNCEDGALLNNGFSNIFFVLVDGELVVLHVGGSSEVEWSVDGWQFGKSGIWRAGNRVFRNSFHTL